MRTKHKKAPSLTITDWKEYDSALWREVRAQLRLQHTELQWTRETPKTVGWYWVRDSRKTRRDEENSYGKGAEGSCEGAESVVFVRKYVDCLAVNNSNLPWPNREWAGPIPQPKEKQ